MNRRFLTILFFQPRNNLIGNLPRNAVSFSFRHIIHQEDVSVFLVQRQRVDMNDLSFPNEIVEHPSITSKNSHRS